jgi:DNA-binding MarR family transcriptional regulator
MSDAAALSEARLLRRAIARLQRSFRQSRDIDAPTPAQLSALGTLRRDGAMATGELAERERLKPQSVTRLVAALIESKLVERVADPADRRRQVLAITDEGSRRLGREMQRRDERLALEIASLSAGDRATLLAACVLIERMGDPERA